MKRFAVFVGRDLVAAEQKAVQKENAMDFLCGILNNALCDGVAYRVQSLRIVYKDECKTKPKRIYAELEIEGESEDEARAFLDNFTVSRRCSYDSFRVKRF